MMTYLGFVGIWYALAKGLVALVCHGVAASVRLLSRLQQRTGLAKTGRGEPADLVKNIEKALPVWVKATCWVLAFGLTCLLFRSYGLLAG